ncbi:hypothetical protein ABPG72_007246 [Tetrahymena utriculariae]
MNRKFSILAQLLVLVCLYFLIKEVKNNFQYDMNYILTRAFILNTLMSTFSFFQKKERDLLFDEDDILFYNILSYNYFHLFWFINILLNIAMIVNNFSRKLFILTDSTEDWIYVFSMFFSTYIHYSLHYQVVNFTHMFSQTSTACIFHFLHYSNSFISFLSYLVINQLSYSDNQYKLLQKLLFQLVFCKFFIILSMPLAGDIGKVCYSVMLLLEIKNSIQDIDNNLVDQSKQTQQNNQNNHHTLGNNASKTQFLFILAAITFSILCFSMYKVYKAWKYLELYNIFSGRDIGNNPQRQAISLINSNVRQRAKSTDGLNEVELQTLKKTQFEAIQLEPKQSQPSQTCSICFLEIENKSSIYELECKHVFHSDCLDIWLKNKNSCPNCRSKVIQRSQLVIQSLEDSNITIQSNNISNNNDQLFQQIIRQNDDFLEQQMAQIYNLNQNTYQEEEQIYNPQPSIDNIVDADEENHHHNSRTSDNLQYSSQQYLQPAHY